MPRRHPVRVACLAALAAGCAARAADDPEAIRIDKSSLQIQMTQTREVSVAGNARVSVAPDLAEVSLGVTTVRPSAIAAVEENNRAVAKLVEALKGRKVADKDLQTEQVSINPQYLRPPEPIPGAPPPQNVPEPKIIGYEVINSVRLTTRDLAAMGGLLDAAIESGVNQIDGITFRVEDRKAILADLRPKALDEAKAKAALYAKWSGMSLGLPLTISEHEDESSPFERRPMARLAPAPKNLDPERPFPISPGEQEVSLTVSVSYELKLP